LEDKLAKLEQRERYLARHERQRAAWNETHIPDIERGREVAVELAWRSKARSTARTVDNPRMAGQPTCPIPGTARGRRAWRVAAEQVEGYRDRYHIQTDGLGERPTDLGQLREWRTCHDTAHRLTERTSGRDHDREPQRGRALKIG
jgi:hypothetical protein